MKSPTVVRVLLPEAKNPGHAAGPRVIATSRLLLFLLPESAPALGLLPSESNAVFLTVIHVVQGTPPGLLETCGSWRTVRLSSPTVFSVSADFNVHREHPLYLVPEFIHPRSSNNPTPTQPAFPSSPFIFSPPTNGRLPLLQRGSHPQSCIFAGHCPKYLCANNSGTQSDLQFSLSLPFPAAPHVLLYHVPSFHFIAII